MTNIMLKGGKEIDLLAINPRTNEKFHIECRVSISKGFSLREKDTRTRNGKKHKIGLDTLSATKFEHPTVVAKIKEIFGNSEYKKVLIAGFILSEEVVEKAKSIYNIEIWQISKLVDQLLLSVGSKGHRDDILRTLQLFIAWKTVEITF